MSIQTSWRYGLKGVANDPTHSNFATVLANSERFWFSGSSSVKESLEVGQYQIGTVITDTTGSILISRTNNCRYVDPTSVNLNENGIVSLDSANVAQEDCTAKITWLDTESSTELNNVKLYAFEGTDPTTAPTNLTLLAFERTASGINKNRINGDTEGLAWDADSGGIGGAENALSCSSKSLAASHDFYIGISSRINSYGTFSSVKIRLSFDVS